MTNDQLNIAELPELPAYPYKVGCFNYYDKSQMRYYAIAAQAPLVERIKELEKALSEIAAIEDKEFGDDWEEIEEARIIARAALASSQGEQKEYAWECNECGSQEYTMSVSEDDVNRLGCGRCGGDEWHKAEVRK